jgi:hypothetical protein
MGKASSFEFCCLHGCVPISSTEHGNVLLLKPQISKENFGTCTMNLYGMLGFAEPMIFQFSHLFIHHLGNLWGIYWNMFCIFRGPLGTNLRMRFKEYRFTVLSLQGLSISSALGQEQGQFERFHAGMKTYNASFVSGKPAKFSLDVVPEVETKNIQVRGCSDVQS